MYTDTVKHLLNDTDAFVFVVATGYPSQLQAMLTQPCGTSKLLSGAQFPYSVEESQWFAGTPEPLKVDESGVVDLAHAAYVRAVANLTQLDALHRDAVGLAISAVVATNREHRGAHRALVAATSKRGTMVLSMQLKKGVGDAERAIDAQACDALALDFLGFYVGLNASACSSVMDAWTPRAMETWKPRKLTADEELSAVLRLPFFCLHGRRDLADVTETRRCLVPATLNPLHIGHFDMLQESQLLYGRPATYLVSAAPPRGMKARLTGHEALHRVGQVMGWNRMRHSDHEVLIVGGGNLYEDYARAFPGSIISVGADAALRMLEPCWYNDGDVLAMLKRIEATGCTIRVHPRRNSDGVYQTVGDVIEAAPLGASTTLFKPGMSQHDVSSSELRMKMVQRTNH